MDIKPKDHSPKACNVSPKLHGRQAKKAASKAAKKAAKKDKKEKKRCRPEILSKAFKRIHRHAMSVLLDFQTIVGGVLDYDGSLGWVMSFAACA